MQERPKPFSEDALRPRCPRTHDPFEDFLPKQPGFVRDFVMGLWNSEAPVAYAAWVAVWCLAMSVKRDAWVQWLPDSPLFPNFYIILSGPPSSKKGAAIGRGVGVYMRAIGPMSTPEPKEQAGSYKGLLTEPAVMHMKTHVPLIFDSATSRPIKSALAYKRRRKAGSFYGDEIILQDAEGKDLLDEDGHIVKYEKTSELGVVTEELSTFLGRQKYNEGIVPLMLSVYNTDKYKEDRTGEHGIIKMRNLCTSWLAGTTASSFQDAVAETARGDGFFSRATIVHQDRKWQRFFPPPQWPWLPGVEELARRLAYVAEATLGEHVLTPEADVRAKAWYDEHCDNLETQIEMSHFWSRKDTQLLKLALLMKAQRYPEPGEFDITLADLEDAITLLDATAALAPRILEDHTTQAKQSQLDRVLGHLRKHGGELPRVRLQKLCVNNGINAQELNRILGELMSYQKVSVWRGGVVQSYVTAKNDEVYKLKEVVYGEDTRRRAAMAYSGIEENGPGCEGDSEEARPTPDDGVEIEPGDLRGEEEAVQVECPGQVAGRAPGRGATPKRGRPRRSDGNTPRPPKHNPKQAS